MRNRLLCATSLLLMGWAAACSDNGGGGGGSGGSAAAGSGGTNGPGAGGQTLRLSLSHVEPLKNGFHYEGWAIIGGQPRSTGKFNVDSSGAIVDRSSGAPIPNGDFTTSLALGTASMIVVTIEPTGDNDAVPAATHYLGGPLANGTAEIGVLAAQAGSFYTSTGKYILATPTDTPNDSDETDGIWFLEPTGNTMVPGLTLPALSDGWKLEGWVVINGHPVSTGKFTNVATADEAHPFSGPSQGPPFPGEDFLHDAPAGTGLTFPMDLSGQTAVITVEPNPDDSPDPFHLKPLRHRIPAPAADHTAYTMERHTSADEWPSGMATIR